MTVPARYTLTEAHFRIAELEGRLAEQDTELERLREEWDDAKERIQVWVRHDLSQQGQLRAAEAEADKYRKATDQQARRAEAAEAENRRLRSDPDGVARWRGEAEMYMREFGKQRERADRLTEGLREIENASIARGYERYEDDVVGAWVVDKARALLAGSEPEPDGGGAK